MSKGAVIQRFANNVVSSLYSEQSDAELLERFVMRREEWIFAALARRLSPIVWGVCRRMLGNHHDAEDAFQATFLVLFRKAQTIRPAERVGCWIQGVAIQVCRKSRALNLKRRRREKTMTILPEPTEARSDAAFESGSVVHLELSRLPQKYRAVILACDLERKSHKEASQLFGCAEGTISARLSRGREMLARRLARRGVVFSAAGIMGIGSELSAGCAVPPRLLTLTIEATRMVANYGTLAVPVAALYLGVLRTMAIAQWKLFAAAFVVLGMTAIGTIAIVSAKPLREASQAAKDVDTPNKRQAKEPTQEMLAQSRDLLAEAVKALESEPEGGRRLAHRTLADMAVLAAYLKKSDESKAIFRKSVDRIDNLGDARPSEVRTIAPAMASAGLISEAMSLAETATNPAKPMPIPGGPPIDPDQWKNITYQEIATALAKKGNEKDALQAVEKITNEPTKKWLRSYILLPIVRRHAQAGRFQEAFEVTDRIPDRATRIAALAGFVYLNLWSEEGPTELGIAQIQAEARNRPAALESMNKARRLADQVVENGANTWMSLACGYARLGEVTAAKECAEKIDKSTGRAIAYASIARALVRAGKMDDAAAIVNLSDESEFRIHVQIHLAAEIAKRGTLEAKRKAFADAEKFLSQSEDKDRHLYVHNLISALGEAGLMQEAEAAAAKFGCQDDLSIINAVYSQAKAGKFAEALDRAKSIKQDNWHRGNLIRAISQLQTDKQGPDPVLGWARKLESGHDRADALFGIALALSAMDAN
jgi:RNA polymerase sigma factor (sigma-70 family)